MTEWYDSIVSSVKNALEAIYIKKSNTSGLVKNDGTIDTNSYLTTNQGVAKSNTAGLLKNDGTVDTNSYLNTNQGAGNYGKFLKIDNNGNIICQSASFSGQDLAVTQISGTDNLNNYKTTGFYYITNNNSNNITNIPPFAELYDTVLMVEGKSNGYVQQMASVNDNIYIRSYENTSDVWTNWINIRTPIPHKHGYDDNAMLTIDINDNGVEYLHFNFDTGMGIYTIWGGSYTLTDNYWDTVLDITVKFQDATDSNLSVETFGTVWASGNIMNGNGAMYARVKNGLVSVYGPKGLQNHNPFSIPFFFNLVDNLA